MGENWEEVKYEFIAYLFLLKATIYVPPHLLRGFAIGENSRTLRLRFYDKDLCSSCPKSAPLAKSSGTYIVVFQNRLAVNYNQFAKKLLAISHNICYYNKGL